MSQIIDDDLIVFSTLFSGSELDTGDGIAIDKTGAIYIVGQTSSPDFPILNGFDEVYTGGLGDFDNSDLYVSKFLSNGSLIWSTYLGGWGHETMFSEIVTDNENNVIIASMTTSSDFPVLNAFNDAYNGEFVDIIITKFNSTGAMLWSTYFGGEKGDTVGDVKVDSNNNIILVGSTGSNNFPLKNANDEKLEINEAFISKFNASGELIWSTYLGGSGEEYANGVALDENDNIFVTGTTDSTDFLLIGNTTSGKGTDTNIFVTMVSPFGDSIWSTIFGGSNKEVWPKIEIDYNNNIVISGLTDSNDFPLLDAKDDIKSTQYEEGFITKFSSDKQILWSTYLGGSNHDHILDLSIDKLNNIYVIGNTNSNDFPIVNAYDDMYGPHGFLSGDAFVSVLQPSGDILWSSYFGGSGVDTGYAITVDEENVIITGYTTSDDIPFKNSYQNASLGSLDAYIFKGSLEVISLNTETSTVIISSESSQETSSLISKSSKLETNNGSPGTRTSDFVNGLSLDYFLLSTIILWNLRKLSIKRIKRK